MIRAHRRCHRIAFIVLAVTLPLVLAWAIFGRRGLPPSSAESTVTTRAETSR